MGVSYLLSCALLLAGGHAEFQGGFSGIMWQGGFEPNNLQAEYSEIVGNNFDGKEITQGADGIQPQCGDRFMKVTLNGGMTAFNHNRNEIGFHPVRQTGDGNMQGTVRYYGWSMAQSSSRPLRNSNYELAYWESENVFSQTLGFATNGGDLIFRTRGNGQPDQTVGTMNFEAGRWHDFVMGVKWSAGGDGWVELWKDGQVVTPRRNVATLQGGNPSFSHFGIFRIPRVGDEVVMYFDCAVYATGFDVNGCYDDGECPTPDPTELPTLSPTNAPTEKPTPEPTLPPTFQPTTPMPTSDPTEMPVVASIPGTAANGATPTIPTYTGQGGLNNGIPVNSAAPVTGANCAGRMEQCGGRMMDGSWMQETCCAGGSLCVKIAESYHQCQGGAESSEEEETVNMGLVAALLALMCLALTCSLATCYLIKKNNEPKGRSGYRAYSDSSDKRRRRNRGRSRSRSRSPYRKTRRESETYAV